MTCDKCTFWEKSPRNEVAPGPTYGRCEGVPELKDVIGQTRELPLAVTYDAENYYSEHRTLPNFSCILFEAKP